MEIIKDNGDGTVDAFVQTANGTKYLAKGMFPIGHASDVSSEQQHPQVELKINHASDAVMAMALSMQPYVPDCIADLDEGHGSTACTVEHRRNHVYTGDPDLIAEVIAKVNESHLQMAIPPHLVTNGLADELSPSFVSAIGSVSRVMAGRSAPRQHFVDNDISLMYLHVAQPFKLRKPRRPLSKRRLKIMESRRDIDAEILQSIEEMNRGEYATRTHYYIDPKGKAHPANSVCLMVHDEDGKLLVVSRKDNHNDLGMPGGKIEPGEDADWAILRECAEELGVDYQKEDLKLLYVGPCGPHVAACYVLRDKRHDREIREARIPIDIINSEGALVTRVDSMADISDPAKSCFAEYNARIMQHLAESENVH